MTGRSMDWFEKMNSNFYLFPRGMTKKGGTGKNVLKWTSLYGSIAVSVYEGGTVDGMNEKGLVANLLFLTETEYPLMDSNKPFIYVSAWAQYVLDNFKNVSEAVKELQKERFTIKTSIAPNGIK